MFRYILNRVVMAVATLFVVSTLTFVLMKLLPGDPFYDPKLKPDVKEALMERYGFDKPILTQYVIYMKGLLQGDLGTSIKHPGRKVTDTIIRAFPKSFALGWRAMFFAVLIGLIFGIYAALKHGKWQDYLVIFIAILGVSIPSIVLGPILAYQFGVNLGWLPVVVTKDMSSYILPAIALGVGTLAFVSRMMRTTSLEVLHQDYIQTAKSKGLGDFKIITRHVVKNAIMPVVTVLGPLFAAIITGSIVIEKIFAVAGLGEYFISTIFEQDYTMLMGITIFYSALIIFSILVVDLAYGFLDPRLRVSSKGKRGKK